MTYQSVVHQLKQNFLFHGFNLLCGIIEAMQLKMVEPRADNRMQLPSLLHFVKELAFIFPNICVAVPAVKSKMTTILIIFTPK